MSGPTVNKQKVSVGDTLFMVTSGLMVQVVDTSATRFVIRLPGGRTQNYGSEPVISRESGKALFYWEDITQISTIKNRDIVKRFAMFNTLCESLRVEMGADHE